MRGKKIKLKKLSEARQKYAMIQFPVERVHETERHYPDSCIACEKNSVTLNSVKKHGIKKPLEVEIHGVHRDCKDCKGEWPNQTPCGKFHAYVNDGHHRLRKAKEAGLKTVPIRFPIT